MRKIVAVLIVVAISLSFVACGKNEEATSTVDTYKKIVQEYIDKGDIETAKKALEEGISLTGDEELKKLLEQISGDSKEPEASSDESQQAEANESPDVKEADANTEEVKEENVTPDKEDILSQLSAEAIRDLNIFLSNFSEAYFDDYSQSDYDDVELIRFSFTHNNINSPDKIIWSGNYMGISAEDVDGDAQRFFGKTVTHQSVEEWSYMDGIFMQPAASGESYAVFSIVSSVVDNKDGTFDVEFYNFFDENNSSEVTLSEWYSYDIHNAGLNCSFSGIGTAKIKAKVHNGKNTYELLEYTKAK